MHRGLHGFLTIVKPLCDSITTNPTEEQLIELKNYSEQMPQHVIQKLHEYIMFPLFINLQSSEFK